MEKDYKVTVNADRRYYLDEGTIKNPGSLLSAIDTFNCAVIDLYNVLYSQEFEKANKADKACFPCHEYLTGKYHMNAYYTGAVYTAASGAPF